MTSNDSTISLTGVRRHWRNQTVSEYCSAAITAELFHWLIVVGAPPYLMELARRTAGDELQHAADSRAVFVAAGGDAASIPLDPAKLWSSIAPGQPVHERVMSTIGRVFCCGETVAVPLFQAMAAETTEPAARTMLERVLLDEPVHSAFGWEALDSLVEQFGDGARGYVQTSIPGWINGVIAAYSLADGATPRTPSAAERAWGLIRTNAYREIVIDTVRTVIAPRFQKRGYKVEPS